jgi:hypothetical protein
MPVNVIQVGDGGVIIRGEEVVTGRELIDSNYFLYGFTEKIKTLKYQIVDTTQITEVIVSKDEITAAAGQDKRASEINPDLLIAFVANNDLISDLCRIWQAATDSSSIASMLFSNMESAHEWINGKLKDKS